MTYQAALAWLYATQRFGIKLGLENAERLFAALQLPSPQHRVVHVAGTNGKGSVCALAAAICRAEGYRTGLFTSPHLVSFRERIQVNGELIGEEAVAAGLTEIRDLVRDWHPHPTFFEITTALGLQHFANQRCEIVILETGLGGRLDATNAMKADVAVLTPIAFDHQAYLGNTLAEIAGEKAGIIKPHTSVVSANQDPGAEEIIRARAAQCAAPLRFVHEAYHASAVGLLGEHQEQNAALAIAALAAADIGVSKSAIENGLARVEWPARFQRWDDRLVIDGAHNEASAKTLAATWRGVFGDERAQIVFGMLRDKDARAIWQSLAPIASRVLLPSFAGERAMPGREICETIAESSPAVATFEVPSIAAALTEARKLPGRILLTGSLHFAGEALAFLRGRSAAFEECAQ